MLTKSQAKKIEARENIYINRFHGIYNHESRDAEVGWKPIPESWVPSVNEIIVEEVKKRIAKNL